MRTDLSQIIALANLDQRDLRLGCQIWDRIALEKQASLRRISKSNLAKLSGLLRANMGDQEERFDLNKYLKQEVDKIIYHVLPDLPEQEMDRMYPGLRKSKNFH